MSGGQQSSAGAGAGGSFSYGLTPGNNGGTAGVFGYSTLDSNPGSLSPIGTLNGVTIQRIRSSTSSEDLLVGLQGIRAQTFWRAVVVQGTDGTWRRFLAASATFLNPVNTTWQFGTGSSPVFTATTPAPRGVIFFL